MDVLKKILGIKFIRFFLVGIVNSIFGYGIFAFFIFIGIHYSLAVFMGTVLGILFNFKTTGRIVFNSNNNMLVFKFFGVYVVTMLLSILSLSILKRYSVSEYIGGFVLLLPMALVAFFLNSRFVFSERPLKKVA